MKKFDSKIIDFAKKRAEKLAKSKPAVQDVLHKAQEKAHSHRDKIQEVYLDLKDLFQLLKYWLKGEYNQMPWSTIIAALAAIIYFLNPFDLIADVLTGIGFLDDIVVVSYLMTLIRKDLEDFQNWKSRHAVEISN